MVAYVTARSLPHTPHPVELKGSQEYSSPGISPRSTTNWQRSQTEEIHSVHPSSLPDVLPIISPSCPMHLIYIPYILIKHLSRLDPSIPQIIKYIIWYMASRAGPPYTISTESCRKSVIFGYKDLESKQAYTRCMILNKRKYIFQKQTTNLQRRQIERVPPPNPSYSHSF